MMQCGVAVTGDGKLFKEQIRNVKYKVHINLYLFKMHHRKLIATDYRETDVNTAYMHIRVLIYIVF